MTTELKETLKRLRAVIDEAAKPKPKHKVGAKVMIGEPATITEILLSSDDEVFYRVDDRDEPVAESEIVAAERT